MTESPAATAAGGVSVPALVAVPPLRPGATPFRLGRTPVTNRQYAPFAASGRAAVPPWFRHPDFSAPDQPVVGATWDEAMAFGAWLSEAAGGVWRLPTAEEWEFAARGGRDSAPTPWGDAVPQGEIPEGPLAGPWETGRGTPNGYGLFDMGTIVHEWCLDASRPGRRASCGGSWRHAIRWSPPSARSSLPPGYRYSDYGFRVLGEGCPP